MKKIILGLLMFICAVMLTQSVSACSCMMESPEKKFERAAKVYVATTTKIENEQRQNIISLKVLENFKGDKTDSILKTASDTAACGVYFEEDKDYLIFETEDGFAYSCGGSTAFQYVSEDMLDYLRGIKSEYMNLSVFEKIESPVCTSGTDGCNSFNFENGKIGAVTEKFCSSHTPKYSCISRDVFASKQELIDAKGHTCKTITDGVNNFFGRNYMLSTRMGYPENFTPKWSCVEEEAPKVEEEEEILMCTMEYDPVCGVDGKTYGNACSAQRVEIAYKGVCRDNQEDNEKQLDVFRKKLDTKVTTKIDSAVKKYEKRLSVFTKASQKRIHKKLQEKFAKVVDKFYQKSFIGEKYEEMSQRLGYIQLKLEILNAKIMKK